MRFYSCSRLSVSAQSWITRLSFLSGILVASSQGYAQTIITVAGSNSYGDGGLAIRAMLDTPIGLAVDEQGNLFIAELELYRNRIRKVDSQGVITTVARQTSARGLVVNAQGALFFSHPQANRIYQLAPDGVITPVAGDGSDFYHGDGGPATSAGLYSPMGLAIDAQGNLFIADESNHRIRKVTPNGIITTVAGNGTKGFGGDGGAATQASLYYPSWVVVDWLGSLFICDKNNHRIRKVTPDGIITTVAGNGKLGFEGDGGAATQASLAYPQSIVVDEQGTLFINDLSRIRQVSRDGTITTLVEVSNYYSLIRDGQGNLLAADPFSNLVRKITPDGTIRTVAGSTAYGDGGPATLAFVGAPSSVAADQQGSFFTADSYEGNIRQVASDGIISTKPAKGNHVSVDPQGNLFIAQSTTNLVYKLSPEGKLTLVAGDSTVTDCDSGGGHLLHHSPGARSGPGDGGVATQARLCRPTGITIDAQGNLFIADTGHNRIRQVTPDGIITTVAGSGMQGDGGDGGLATQANLNAPAGVAVDARGNLLIADTGNHRIRRVTPDGIITTVAGNGLQGFGGDREPATGGNLNGPTGVAVNAQGNLLIADRGNHRIRQVDAQGVMTTVAGNGMQDFSGDGGAATQASLNSPSAVAVDAQGNLLIADTGNNRIRQVILPPPSIESFSVMNADTEQPIQELASEDTLNLVSLPTRNLNIRANTNSAAIGSVRLVLSGPQNRSQLEQYAPYSLFGNANGDYRTWTPAEGGYRLTATPYSGAFGQGTAGRALTIHFTVIQQPILISYSLINAALNQEIKVLQAGEEVNLATLPTRQLNIRANTQPATVSWVEMVLGGPQSHSQRETQAPYALFGDQNGFYNGWVPAEGQYSLQGVPYNESGGKTTAGTGLTLNFRIIHQEAAGRVSGDTQQPENLVQVYPNPFRESFRLKSSSPGPVVLYDLAGRKVFQLDDLQSEQIIELDPQLAPGFYRLEVGQGPGLQRRKLLKIP
ncbi:putative secreted protein (Por secretion system target) [Larkinella arboricola]|uniref:Putative secreted protein (Por secretion system target) n=1 Tax=Larkinella arboricola TaxID=643671 RepID=A0A327WH81_LARAB|nr:T9SS type A sorting domain-containing protein [Larkinella arboricola]RAJ90040.1 putative secreted protein (Por secretion system target) [Larkinella arboricola]